MRQNSKYRSSLNQVAAIDEKKVKHLGKNYASIDFEIKEHVNPNDFKYGKMKPVVGTFVIGNKRVGNKLKNKIRKIIDKQII